MRALQEVKEHLQPGYVYRRADLKQWSNAVDRHLQQLQHEGVLIQLSGGLYHYPRKTVFGAAPPEDKKLVEAFLKDKRFLLTTPNAYNSLGVGVTQLYNESVVYNHKRHEMVELGGRTFSFRRKAYFPLKLNAEFLFVDLLDNMGKLAEDKDAVLKNVEKKVAHMNSECRKNLAKAVKHYGGVKARKFFSTLLKNECLMYGA